MRRLHLPLAAALALLSGAAGAQTSRVCVEEAGGVCLKYQEVRRSSPAEQAERRLGLGAEERRAVQRGLAADGYYAGAIDGALGARSRGAISAWQRAQGAPATGYLTAEQAATLSAAGTPRPVDPAPAVAATPAPAPAAPAPASPTPAPETAAVTPEAPHPQPGRVYRDGHVTLLGGRVDMEVERVDDANVRIRLVLVDEQGQKLDDTCVAPINGEVTCYMRRAFWNMIQISGRLPRLVATESEGQPQIPIRAKKEVFSFW